MEEMVDSTWEWLHHPSSGNPPTIVLFFVEREAASEVKVEALGVSALALLNVLSLGKRCKGSTDNLRS